jgi:hypothetical protein
MERMERLTAVEWLENQFNNNNQKFINWSEDFFEQAKEMEKEQIIEFAKDCIHKDDCFFIVEQYYNQTFKSE